MYHIRLQIKSDEYLIAKFYYNFHFKNGILKIEL